MTSKSFLLGATCVATVLAGCASSREERVEPAQFQAMMQGSFRAEGIAGMDRLVQDASLAACSRTASEPLPDALVQAIEAEALATVKPPSDGRYLGDWREGEKLAQNGRGMTWTDKSIDPAANGGSCYNCHQLAPAEISYGSIGPSLAQYGRLRGVSDPSAPEAQAVLRYTWAKINNAWSSKACSNMPRFGHKGLLNEQQIRHVMALLLDPASPVNAP